MLHITQGSAAAARDELNPLLAADADDRASRFLLAQAWLSDGHAELARQQLKLALSADFEATGHFAGTPDRRLTASAYSLLADIDFRQGDRVGALRAFESAVAADPSYAKAYLGRGALLAASGQLEAAATSFQTCVDLRPDSAVAHNNLAAVLVRLYRDGEALDEYQRALALAPHNSLAHYNVAVLLAGENRLDEAERAFRDALALEPGSAAVQAGLADVRRRRGETPPQAQ